jgi:hypothetical protein
LDDLRIDGTGEDEGGIFVEALTVAAGVKLPVAGANETIANIKTRTKMGPK